MATDSFCSQKSKQLWPRKLTKGLQTNANKSSIPLSFFHFIYLWSFYCSDSNIFHNVNTSCYLAKEGSNIKVIKLIVVQSVVRVSQAFSPNPCSKKTQLFRATYSITLILWDTGFRAGRGKEMQRRDIEEDHRRRNSGDVLADRGKKNNCDVKLSKKGKQSKRETSWGNDLFPTSYANVTVT